MEKFTKCLDLLKLIQELDNLNKPLSIKDNLFAKKILSEMVSLINSIKC